MQKNLQTSVGNFQRYCIVFSLRWSGRAISLGHPPVAVFIFYF